MPFGLPKTQLLTNSFIPRNILLKKVEQAIHQGICCVQYRSAPGENDCYETAKTFAQLCQKTNTNFIVNDHIDITWLLNQEGFPAGIWLGQQDIPAPLARSILGDNVFIGLSLNSVEEAIAANQLPVNAVSANGIFPCNSNPFAQRMGIDGLRNIVDVSKHPVIAIGGITQHNLPNIIEAGAEGIAISGAILRADDTENITRCIVSMFGDISAQNQQEF